MPIPSKPPLNGRILAEFYLSSETVKRSTLRAYAKPQDQQTARVQMYDPVRRIVAEYFRGGRDCTVLDRVTLQLDEKHFDNETFDAKWHKANRTAISNLRGFTLNGTFENVISERLSIKVGKFDVISTANFYADFIPNSSRAKHKHVAVIVNPSGIPKRTEEHRKTWAQIEEEVAFRAAASHKHQVEEIMYLDLVKNELHLHKKSSVRIWSEIDATCERIFRDWRDMRLEMQQDEQETA